MSRISMQLAEQIAKKLTEKKQALIAPTNLEFREFITQSFEATVPKPVMELFKKHSEYVETTNSVYLNEKGFSRENVSLTKAVPSIKEYSVHFPLTDAVAIKAKKLYHVWQKAKDDYKALFEETETALLNLRTFANIEKQLPEAVQYLPQRGLTVIVDTKELRKKLK